MDYYKIVNLVREPFSNSPEPDFFYQSPTHLRCLQRLELAVRLRRGLNVVLGQVGTGKTTLCRHLLLKFAEQDGGADSVETHLLMDPGFNTALEFLTTVALSFGIMGKKRQRSHALELQPLPSASPCAPAHESPSEGAAATPGKRPRRLAGDAELTDWRLKEAIKGYLFKRGVDEQKIVVLIIDEGQKLPDFCLEILREFLNYETNNHKLLQIIVFGQPEFRIVLDRMKNVADRVNFLYVLQPLDFRETREMIRYRLAKASEQQRTPQLFSGLGMLAVYLHTRGYPRQIVTLCHQALLALIIQNRARAGWFLVRSCAGRLAPADKPRLTSFRWAAGLSAVAVSAALIIDLYPRTMPMGSSETAPAAGQEQPQETKRPPQEAAAVHQKPDLLGKLSLKNGRTVWWMLTDCYGQYDGNILRAVAKVNPQLKNLNRVPAGAIVNLPALEAETNPLAAGKVWVQIASSADLEAAYEFYRTHKPAASSLWFLPHWNPRQGVVFSILLREGFADHDSARRGIAKLPPVLAAQAVAVSSMAPDTVFYTR